ncbi:MAG: hypothetical protein H0T92_10010 [Pyrinomonadaceae bacterium]|nr:hypothetical protein [Pyrinomonadaceae bacterium]
MILKIFLLSCAALLVVCPTGEGITSRQKALRQVSQNVAQCPTITLDCPTEISQDKHLSLTSIILTPA